jgi:integrase
MANLTEAKIRKLKWDPSKGTTSGRQIHSDGVVKGLQLRVLKPKTSGTPTKNFYQAYGPSTNRKFYKVGEWGDITLDQARQRARKIRRDFYDLGIDPNQARQQRLQAAEDRLTFTELIDAYFVAKTSDPDPRNRWAPSTQRNSNGHRKKLVSRYGKMMAEDLTKDHAEKLFLELKEKTPSQAKHLRMFGQALYRWAMGQKKVPQMDNPFTLSTSGGKDHLADPPDNIRKRHLDYKKTEATRLLEMLADYPLPRTLPAPEPHPTYQSVMKLFLLTGFRSRELRNLRWEHINVEERTILNFKPSAKGRSDNPAYKQYLCDTALELLEGLGTGHIRFRKGPVFAGQKGKGRPAGPTPTTSPLTHWGSWEKRKKITGDPRMPVADEFDIDQLNPNEKRNYITPHDLRRSAVTWLQHLGVGESDRTLFKGGVPKGVTEATYSHARTSSRKKCCLLIEQLLEQIEKGNEAVMFEHYEEQAQTLVTAS